MKALRTVASAMGVLRVPYEVVLVVLALWLLPLLLVLGNVGYWTALLALWH